MSDPISNKTHLAWNPPVRPVAAPAAGVEAPAVGMASDDLRLQGPTDFPAIPEPAAPPPSGKYKDLQALASKTRTDENTWGYGRPLSEAKNAHKTNTVEQMEEALKSDENYFECDLRVEIDPPHRPECRHDPGSESGDNLLLDEWLSVAKRSGRGMKFDIKEGEAIPAILDRIEASGASDERMMFNLGDGDMAKYAEEIRRRFPLATVAVNPSSDHGGEHYEGPMQDWQVDRMIELAERAGPPVTFVVRFDLLTDAAIAKLKEHGTISVWNGITDPEVNDPGKVADELRARGVNGVVDIRKTLGWEEKAEAGIDIAKNKVRDFFHDHNPF